MSQTPHDRLLIIDFGSQVTQLIARRLRELNVYCEIHPFQQVTDAFLDTFAPKAVIFSGGPAKGKDAILEEVRGIAEGGGFGSIMGRNSFQRPKNEAIELLHEVMDIHKNA